MIDSAELERLDGSASYSCSASDTIVSTLDDTSHSSLFDSGIERTGGESRAMRSITSLAAVACIIALLGAMPIAETDAVNATAVVQHQLNVADLDASMAYEKPYAVVFWGASREHGAGEALLKAAPNHAWTLVKITAGSLKDAALLQSLGVPAATARALVSDLTQFRAP